MIVEIAASSAMLVAVAIARHSPRAPVMDDGRGWFRTSRDGERVKKPAPALVSNQRPLACEAMVPQARMGVLRAPGCARICVDVRANGHQNGSGARYGCPADQPPLAVPLREGVIPPFGGDVDRHRLPW